MTRERSKKHEARMQALNEYMSEEARGGDLYRARSVTVGTSFGGTTEMMMRRNDGTVVWAPLQPVEVIELIHQLAANVGCHLHLTPRRDFASWRSWQVTEEERAHLNGFPPFPNDITPALDIGRHVGHVSLIPTEDSGDNQNADPALAIEKPKKRGRPKRAAAAS